METINNTSETPIFTKKKLLMKKSQLRNVMLRSGIAIMLFIVAILSIAIIAKQLKPTTDTTLQSLSSKQEVLAAQLRTLKQERSALVLSLDEIEKKVQSTRTELELTENLIKEEINKNLPEFHKTSERILPVQPETVATISQEEVKK